MNNNKNSPKRSNTQKSKTLLTAFSALLLAETVKSSYSSASPITLHSNKSSNDFCSLTSHNTSYALLHQETIHQKAAIAFARDLNSDLGTQAGNTIGYGDVRQALESIDSDTFQTLLHDSLDQTDSFIPEPNNIAPEANLTEEALTELPADEATTTAEDATTPTESNTPTQPTADASAASANGTAAAASTAAASSTGGGALAALLGLGAIAGGVAASNNSSSGSEETTPREASNIIIDNLPPDLNPLAFELSNLDGSNGFTIDGVSFSELGFAVHSAGDVNNDGIDDLIIGAYRADSLKGESYVIFGNSTPNFFGNAFDISSLDGDNGFSITGPTVNGYTGFSVSGAGDINGDGFDDLIIGAPNRLISDPGLAGKSYVIYGASGGFSPNLELSDKAEMIKQISNDPYQLIGAFMKVEMTLSADARIDLHDSPCVADEYSSESGMSLGS